MEGALRRVEGVATDLWSTLADPSKVEEEETMEIKVQDLVRGEITKIVRRDDNNVVAETDLGVVYYLRGNVNVECADYPYPSHNNNTHRMWVYVKETEPGVWRELDPGWIDFEELWNA